MSRTPLRLTAVLALLSTTALADPAPFDWPGLALPADPLVLPAPSRAPLSRPAPRLALPAPAPEGPVLPPLVLAGLPD